MVHVRKTENTFYCMIFLLFQAAFNQVLLENIPSSNGQDLVNLSRCITPEKPFEEETDTEVMDPHKNTLEDLMKSISEKLTITNNAVDTSIARANTCTKPYSNNDSSVIVSDDNIFPEKNGENPTTAAMPKAPKLAPPRSILRNTSRTPPKNAVSGEGGRNPLVEMKSDQEEIKCEKTPERCCCTVKFQPSEDQVIKVETQVVTLKYLMKELFKSVGDHR